MIIWNFGTPEETAKALVDKDLDKQIKTLAQVLCQIHYQYIDYNAETLGHAQVLAGQIPIYDRTVFDNRRNEYSDWGYKCLANYMLLVEIGLECGNEYTYRFTQDKEVSAYSALTKWKKHKLQPVIDWARDNVPSLPIEVKEYSDVLKRDCYIPMPTPFPLCVRKEHIKRDYHPAYPNLHNDDYKSPINIIESYRNYYRSRFGDKIPAYTRREAPDWLLNGYSF